MLIVSTADLLKRVRVLLSSPVFWMKGTLAADAKGVPTDKPQLARCFCLYGAIWRVGCEYNELHQPRIIDKMCQFIRKVFMERDDRNVLGKALHRAISTFNDDPNTTHKDVLKVLDRAIELAEGDTYELRR